MTDVQTTTDAELSESEPAGTGATSTRRVVLLGAGAVGATAVLAACGTSSTGTNSTGSDFSNDPAPAGSSGAQATGAGGATGGGSTGGGTSLAKVADVQVGSGVITASYVITQPEAGTFKAFSKVCPHQGCDVNKVDAGVIKCPCHGSQFSIKDGSVTAGPATKGLAETSVKVSGANIVSA